MHFSRFCRASCATQMPYNQKNHLPARQSLAWQSEDLLVHAAVKLASVPMVRVAAAADQQRVPGEGEARRARAQHVADAAGGVAWRSPHLQSQHAQWNPLSMAHLNVFVPPWTFLCLFLACQRPAKINHAQRIISRLALRNRKESSFKS